MIAKMAQKTEAIDLQTLQDSIQIENILIEKSNLTSSLIEHSELIEFEDTALEHNNGVTQYIRNTLGGQTGDHLSQFPIIPIISN